MVTYGKLGTIYAQKDYVNYIKAFNSFVHNKYGINYGLDHKVLFFYAKSLEHEKRYEEAILPLEIIVKHLNPNNYTYFTLGRLYRLTNNLEKAKENMEKCIELEESKRPQAPFELGKIYYAMGNLEEASKNFRLSIDIDHENNAHAYYELAKIYYDLGKVKKAEELLKICLNQESVNKSHALYLLGKIYSQSQKYVEAEKTFRKCIEVEKRSTTQTYFELAKVLRDQNKFEESIECFKKALETKPFNEVLIKFEFAKAYILAKKYNEAEKLLLYCTKKNNDAYVNYELGKLYMILKRTSEAKDQFNICLSKSDNHNNTLALIELAKVANNEGNTEKTVEYLEALKGAEHNSISKYQLAKLYFDLNLLDECESILNELISEDRDNTLIYLFISKIYEKRGNLDKALEILLNLHNNQDSKFYHRVLYTIALIYEQKKEFETAKVYIQKYNEITEQKNPFGHFELGKIYTTLKDYEKAKEEFKVVNVLDKDSFVYAYFELGRLYAYTGEYAESEKNFLKCLEIEKGANASTHFELGKLYETIGENKKSEYHYKKAIEIDDGQVVYSFLYLGSLYVKMHDYENALKCYQESTRFEGFGHADLGKTYSLMGNFEKAEEEFQIAFSSIEKDRFKTYFEYGRMLIAKKEYTKAKNYLLKALEMSDDDEKCHKELGFVYDKLDDHENSLKHYQRGLSKSYERQFGIDLY